MTDFTHFEMCFELIKRSVKTLDNIEKRNPRMDYKTGKELSIIANNISSIHHWMRVYSKRLQDDK